MSVKLAGFLRTNLIALIALFIALGGTSYAASRPPANSVGSKQLRNGAVTAKKIKAGAVGTAAIASDAVTGDKVLESSLGKVPSAVSADAAANATHAASADSAANATHAASADTAGDSAKWGGVSAGALGKSLIASGISFRPYSETATWTFSGASVTSSAVGNTLFVAPVSLPQGARVTKMTQHFALTIAGTQGALYLVQTAESSSYGDGLMLISSTATAAGAGSLSPSPASPVTVDNTANSYCLQWLCPGSGNAYLVSVKLEYTIP
jgi:hypothetical protein